LYGAPDSLCQLSEPLGDLFCWFFVIFTEEICCQSFAKF